MRRGGTGRGCGGGGGRTGTRAEIVFHEIGHVGDDLHAGGEVGVEEDRGVDEGGASQRRVFG